MLTTNNARLAAANMLLDRGVRYIISDAPLIWKLLRLNRIQIRPLKAGTIMEISRIIDENKLDEIKDNSETKEILESVACLIAIAVLNNKLKIKYFTPLFSKFILWKIPAKIMFSIFYHIIQANNLADFMSITRYFGHQAQMMMNPKNMGQQQTGS